MLHPSVISFSGNQDTIENIYLIGHKTAVHQEGGMSSFAQRKSGVNTVRIIEHLFLNSKGRMGRF
jgi:hypothetical protein